MGVDINKSYKKQGEGAEIIEYGTSHPHVN